MKYTKAMRIADFYNRMEKMGFTHAETETLRLAQLTLHRWAERECNGEIERDETTGKVHPYNHNGDRMKYTVPDREKGALKRIAKIVSDRNTRNWIGFNGSIAEMPTTLHAYHQTDPRGCSLYLVSIEQLGGADISSVYNRGFGVCI